MLAAAVGMARSYDRLMYFLRVSFNDRAADQILDLVGLDLEQAETFAGELRYEVQQAGEVGAPVVQLTVPGTTEPTTFEPGRIVGIDLEETTDGQAAPGDAAR